MDARIEELFVVYLKKEKLPVEIFSEEEGRIEIHPNPKYLIAFDPLDGSTNYKLGKGLYPYGTLIAIYKGLTPTFDDIVAAGVWEQTRGLGWVYEEGRTTDLKGTGVALRHKWVINRSTPVYLDLYYERGYELYRKLQGNVFIRNTGSTIGNLSYILSDIAAVTDCVRMGSHEAGAVYALIKGAGGKVVDHKGRDLGQKPFVAGSHYEILGGNEKVVHYILELLNK